MRFAFILAALVSVAHPALAAVESDMATPDYISERPERYTNTVEFTGTLDASKGTLIVPDGTEFLQASPADGSVTEAKLHADLSSALPRVADLASTDNGKGASMIGIEDAGTLFTAADVEGALAEVRGVANGAVQATDLSSNANSEGASLVGVEDSGGLYDATDVEAALAEVKTVANAAAPSSDLASNANGKGASLIGVEDAGENYGGATNVEAVLLALHNRIAALENPA